MKKFRWGECLCACFVAAIVVTVCVVFSACGTRGPAGRDGHTVLTDYITYLNKLWDDDIIDAETKALYGDKTAFLVQYPRDNLFVKGDTGPAGTDNAESFVQAADIAVRSTVEITAIRTGSVKTNWSGAGSGVLYKLETYPDPVASGALYTGNGFIVTNYHVIAEYFKGAGLVIANTVELKLYGLSDIGIPAVVVGGLPEKDIAVLRITGTDHVSISNHTSPTKTVKDVINMGYTVVDAANKVVKTSYRPAYVAQNIPSVGSSVIAVGNPLGQGMSVTNGVISRTVETIRLTPLDGSQTAKESHRVIRISAGINPGNSGGGLFAADGRLIGITQSRLDWYGDDADYLDNDIVANIAFAIPVDVFRRIADQVLEFAVSTNNYNNPYIVGRHAATFTAKANPAATITVDDPESGRLVTVESVTVTTAGTYNNGENSLSVGKKILAMKVGGAVVEGELIGDVKTYIITRAYMVEDILIEAYGKLLTIVTE